MKKILFTAAVLLLANFTFAQFAYVEKFGNGNKKCEGSYTSAVVINDNDTKEVKAQKMASAQRVGKWTYWYESGAVAGEQYFTNGVSSGIWKSWYVTGKQETEINFTTGVYTSWSTNGNMYEKGKVNTDMSRDGNWVGNYESGVKNYEGSYKNGQKNGKWNFYDEKGTLYYTEIWTNGVKN